MIALKGLLWPKFGKQRFVISKVFCIQKHVTKNWCFCGLEQINGISINFSGENLFDTSKLSCEALSQN